MFVQLNQPPACLSKNKPPTYQDLFIVLGHTIRSEVPPALVKTRRVCSVVASPAVDDIRQNSCFRGNVKRISFLRLLTS